MASSKETLKQAGKTQYESGIQELNENIEKLNLALQNPDLSEQEKAVYQGQLTVLQQRLQETEAEYNKYIEETYTPSVTQIYNEKEPNAQKEIVDEERINMGT